MVERTIQSPEAEELTRDPYNEVFELLGITDDGKSSVSISRKYETPEVDVVLSGNNIARSRYDSVTIELYHSYSRFAREGEKTRSAVFHIRKDGSMNGMLYEEYIPGVDRTFAWSPHSEAERINRHEQVLRVVDFVKEIAQAPMPQQS